MRIRRRPPFSLPPLTSFFNTPSQPSAPSQPSDPTPPHLHALCGPKHGANVAQKLHQPQDPHCAQLELTQHANRSPDSPRFRTCAASSHSLQLVKSEVKEEEGMMDSIVRSAQNGHELQVNSKKWISSNEMPLVEDVAYAPRRRKGASYNYATNEGASSKARVKGRSKASGSAASLNDSSSENSNGGREVKENAPNNGGKKRRAPAVLMEGSRCSRVNGRGWRCCQQTLVGYSLCEHHLGKGRLRSMSSVRGKLGTSKANAPVALPSSSSSVVALDVQMRHQGVSAENNGLGELSEERMVKRKRKKSGTLRARSVTSLLSEGLHSDLAELPQSEEVALLLLGATSLNNGI